MMRANLLGALLALPAGLHAQEQRVAETTLPPVKAVSPRVADTGEVDAARSSRITAADMTTRQVNNIKDAVRDEPGVSVTRKPSRFGLSGFNIRGLEDNRILMQVDGVRLPDSFVFGGYSSASRDMVDIELLEAIDIQRGTGPARSSSDALGGVVSYETPQPEAVLAGRPMAGVVKSLYQSVDRSTALVGTVAAGDETTRLLVRGVTRSGREAKTKGQVGGTGIRRTRANPQQQDSEALLAKVAFAPTPHYRAELAYQQSHRDVATNVLSGVVGGLARDMNTADRYRHALWSIDQRLSDTPLGRIDVKLFRQDSRTSQATRQDRIPTASAFSEVLYERYFDFQQEIRGAKVDIATRLAGSHLLNWGADSSLTHTTELRDGYTTLKNGTVTRAVTVDVFPTRDTPPSETRRWALYAQDEWFATETLTFTTGGRYERYRLTPRPDAVYLANVAAAPVANADFSNVSPKLGGVWQVGRGYAVAAQVAKGFRAPPYDDVNIGFANFDASYTAVANPALKEETSRNVEVSLRHADDAGNWSLTAFDNRYRNFIEQAELDCPGDPACSPLVALTFQAQNLSRVRIHGAEARFARELAPGWRTRGALAYAKGRNVVTGSPIFSINPASGSLGLEHTRGAFRYDLSTNFAQRKRAHDAAGSNRQFLPAGYAVVDLRLTWAFGEGSQLSLGAFNLFDRLYSHWADVPVSDIHVPDSQAGPERYSQPGRNVAVSLRLAI